jgi:Raf kinase inhibitor-like YbhB/YbcL family protein
MKTDLFRVWSDSIDPLSRSIDPRYTCDLDNSSPEIRWENPPKDTLSLALVLRDPDASAGNFYHWMVYSIPSSLGHLPAGIPAQELLPNGVRQGLNSQGRLGYYGPCPPQGDPAHRYIFELYALSGFIDQLPKKPTPGQLLPEISRLSLGKAACEANYKRMARQFPRKTA